MPYRRLPNTDLARIRALECAIEKEQQYGVKELAVTYKVINEAKSFLNRFKKAQLIYQQCFNEQVKASKKYQGQMKMARLYISHFIQVLNMSVIRREFKKEVKFLYGLDPDNQSVPDLSAETALVEWGEKIISGENERIKKGGVPIYNPTIAKVSVHYEIFKEAYFNQKNFQQSTNRNLEQLAGMRDEADALILEIWNQVEEKFKDLPSQAKMERCMDYGVIYYFRKKEKELLRQARLQQKFSFDD